MSFLSQFDGPVNVLVVGASRGLGLGFVEILLGEESVAHIFAASRSAPTSESLVALRTEHPSRLTLLELDVTRESTIEGAVEEIRKHVDDLHLILNVAGFLHNFDHGMRPEKKLDDLDPDQLQRSFAINAIGPILVVKHVYPMIRHGSRAVIANLSARVGSIGDNHIGGWYGYRASKAAQNMFTRTMSIELGRKAPRAICIALHPGTVDTELSEPFQSGVPESQLFTVERAVSQLLEVINSRTPEDTGQFFDWAGKPVEW